MSWRIAPSARSRRGLDWLNFFVANAQTGFGPFIAVYLTAQAWTLRDIGNVLAIGTLASMVSQIPGGAVVDALRNKQLAALAGGLAVAFSALIFAFWPHWLPVLVAEILHGFASCILGPAIAAISLQLVGRAKLGERLGRNTSFAALGSGVAAAIFGASGTYVSERSVFYLTALLMLPGMIALMAIAVPPAAPASTPRAGRAKGTFLGQMASLLSDRRVLIFAACILLFHLSNAAMLPLAASEVTRSVGVWASMVVAACIVLPQLGVAVISPLIGRLADRRGRRLVLLLGFAALPARALLLALISNPYALIPVQMLDGVSAGMFGVMLPLIAADLTVGTNRFNLCIGTLSLAMGIGAALSTVIAGDVAQAFSPKIAFMVLGLAGLAATLLVLVAMPETRGARDGTEAAP
ncbi:MAG: MFS transporter [Rhodospirillales bacterium]|nr:MFS transporter [Rhodospirillales bacterium]